MAAQSTKITLYIFLFALFIMLGMVIGIRIYNIYTGSKAATEKTIKSTMGCEFFSFSVSNILYEQGSLSFDLKTTDDKLLKKIVIVGDNDMKKEIELGRFLGFEQRVDAGQIEVSDSFGVYPYGCESQNSKRCSVSIGKCENIKLA